MPVLEWTYLPAEWDRHVRAQAAWLRGVRLRSGLLFFVIGTPVAIAVGFLERALLPPLIALAVLSVIGAVIGGRIGLFRATHMLVRAGRSPPVAVFTSTGVIFGDIARLWRDSTGGLARVEIESGRPRYLRLEFGGRRRPSRVLRVPAPDSFDADLEAFAAQLRSWIPRSD
jgi:hypothetical protein